MSMRMCVVAVWAATGAWAGGCGTQQQDSADAGVADGASPGPIDLAGADLAARADAADGSTPETFTGEATYYDANGTGACGFAASSNFLVAAMNGAQYKKALCGQCVAVTGPQGMVTVRITDLCPGCKAGDLDLSMTAFGMISPLSAGRVKITWSFVACP